MGVLMIKKFLKEESIKDMCMQIIGTTWLGPLVIQYGNPPKSIVAPKIIIPKPLVIKKSNNLPL